MRALIETLMRALVGALFFAALIGGTAALHMRAAQSKRVAGHAVTPIPVASIIVEAAEGYDIVDRFVGRLEPAQTARISFEKGGLVTQVLVEEGQRVALGETIATLDTSLLKAERDRLLGQRQQIFAKYELAQLTGGRKRALRRQDHISQQKLDEARLNTASLKGELAAIDAATRRLDIDIEKSVLRAPFAGTVGARFVDTGVVVAAGTVVAGTTVIDLLESDRPQARIGVSPEAAARLSAGDRVRLFAAGKTLKGRVVAVRPDVSTATRTVSVIMDLVEMRGARFGDTVELRLIHRVEAQGFWLPVSALNEGERGLWTVLTLKKGVDHPQRVGREAVELLHTIGDRVFVRGTLRAGQRVIASGRNRIIPGQLVALAPALEVLP